MADPDYQRLWTECAKALEDARQWIDDLEKDITWMDEDGDVGDELVADVVADNKRLQAKFAEAREIITDECAAHEDDCQCDVCEYWFNHKEAKP